MKILYITDQMYLHGGGERVLTNKANYFIEKCQADIHIVTSEQKGNLPCYSINSETVFHDLGINYLRNKSYFNPSNFLKIFRHFRLLKKVIKKVNPDIIVTLSTQFDFYLLPFIHTKIPKIKEFHSSGHFKALNKKQNKSVLRNIFYKLNDYVESKYHKLAILTHDERQYYKSSNTIVIPNALTNYSDETALLRNKVAISAGRIAAVKGYENLILAWGIVAKKYPDWVIEIYGNGEMDYLNFLNNMLIDKSLQKNIKFIPATNLLEEKMLDASFFVMTSNTECFPMVLLEAMSVGLPIISFDCPNGPRNIITDESNGLLIPNGNIDLLSKGIMALIESQELRTEYGNVGKLDAKKYHEDVIMEQWLKLFKDCKK